MAGLESDKVERVLLKKMHATRRESKDVHYIIISSITIKKSKSLKRVFPKALSTHWDLTEYRKWPIN
jgi:hypothetical protein